MNKINKISANIPEESVGDTTRILRCIDRRHGKSVLVFSRVPTSDELKFFKRFYPDLDYRVELVPSLYVRRMEERQQQYKIQKLEEKNKSLNLNKNSEDKIIKTNNNKKESLDSKKTPVDKLDKNKQESLSIAERFVALDKRFGRHVANFVRDIFPELTELEHAGAEGRTTWVSRVEEKTTAKEAERPPLPEKAPETWKDRPSGRSEDPPSFLLRVYKPWLEMGFTRTHLRTLDRPLYNALATHANRHGMPEELQDFFVSQSKGVDEELERQGISRPRDALERVGDRREAERLYSAAYRRERRGKEPSR